MSVAPLEREVRLLTSAVEAFPGTSLRPLAAVLAGDEDVGVNPFVFIPRNQIQRAEVLQFSKAGVERTQRIQLDAPKTRPEEISRCRQRRRARHRQRTVAEGSSGGGDNANRQHGQKAQADHGESEQRERPKPGAVSQLVEHARAHLLVFGFGKHLSALVLEMAQDRDGRIVVQRGGPRFPALILSESHDSNYQTGEFIYP